MSKTIDRDLEIVTSFERYFFALFDDSDLAPDHSRFK